MRRTAVHEDAVNHEIVVSRNLGENPALTNLGNMPEGDVDAVISSPPFLDQVQAQDPKYRDALAEKAKKFSETQTWEYAAKQLSAIVNSNG